MLIAVIFLLAVGCKDNSKLRLNSDYTSAHLTYYGDHSYTFTFDSADLEECPKWSFGDDMPSLGFKSAAEAARNRLGSVVDDPKQWEISGIALEPLNEGRHWMYSVSFLSPPVEPSSRRDSVEIPVLLSGKTVKPSVQDDEI
jgi:hypothetical protein